MRLRITFSVPPRFKINLNYQHMLGAWIYKCMSKSDQDFAKTWHDVGMKQREADNRSYKFFTFSNLYFHKFSINKTYLNSETESAKLTFTTCYDKLGDLFAGGAIGADFRGMRVASIELLPEPDFTGEATFTTLSPIFVQRDSVHLNPEEHADVYAEAIRHNLNTKYNLFHSANEFFECPKIELLSTPKAKTIAFKRVNDNEFRNKGYLFKFRITGDPRLIEMGYKAGFGQGNAMGFGCVELINNNYGK